MITGCSNEYEKATKIKGVEVLEIKKNDKLLLFYGSRHSNDIKDPMFEEIKKYFIETQPQIVLVEGDANANTYLTLREAIENGESAFVTYLAQNSEIQVESIEPSIETQISHLVKNYSEEDILSMYLLRQIVQYQRESKNGEIDFKKRIISQANDLIDKGLSFDKSVITFENILDIINKNLKTKLNLNNWKEINVYDVVYKNEGSIIRKIYKEVLKMRDDYSCNLIEKKLHQYDRVFVIMGSTHVKNQEKRLRRIFKQS